MVADSLPMDSTHYIKLCQGNVKHKAKKYILAAE